VAFVLSVVALPGTRASQVTRLMSRSSISGRGSTDGGGSRPSSSASAITAATRSPVSSCRSRVWAARGNGAVELGAQENCVRRYESRLDGE
jgi:hypothetical protein